MRADRWIGYPRATDALSRLELLLDWPAKHPMPNLLIAGPTNNGKSMIIERFRRDHLAFQPTHEAAMRGEPVIPVVVMGDARRAVGDPVLRHPARGRRSTGPSPMALTLRSSCR